MTTTDDAERADYEHAPAINYASLAPIATARTIATKFGTHTHTDTRTHTHRHFQGDTQLRRTAFLIGRRHLFLSAASQPRR